MSAPLTQNLPYLSLRVITRCCLEALFSDQFLLAKNVPMIF